MHNTCIKHGRNIRTRYIGSTSILLWRKDWSSIKHDRALSFFMKHSQLIVFRKLLGLEGQVVQQSKSSQSNQLNPSPDHDDRTGQPVVGSDQRTAPCARKTSRSQEIETRSFHEEAVKHDRRRIPVVGRDTNHEPGASQTRSSDDSKSFNVEDKTSHERKVRPVVNNEDSSHEQSMLNKVNFDFRLLGLPHSVVKQAENSRVRELVKKIENHPHRHPLQLDLQQNKAYNPFSTTTKQMIQDVGNVELVVWTVRDGP